MAASAAGACDEAAGAVARPAPADVQSISNYLVTTVPTAEKHEFVGAVRDRISACTYSDLSHLFVLRERRLVGVVEIGRLLSAERAQPVAALMQADGCPVVTSGADREQAASAAIRSGGSALAVCDAQGLFVGAVPARSLMCILRDEHIEDLHQMAGIISKSQAAKDALAASPLRQTWYRLPWLLFGLAGSAMVTGTMAWFEAVFAANIAIAFFVPGIVYLADSIGTQSEVVTIRALSLTDGSLLELLLAEAGTSVLIGLVLGGLAFPLIWIMFANVALAATVAIALLVAGVTATIIGVVLPWGFARIGYDPALASGPVATVLQDVLSLAAYFLTASLLVFHH